MELYQVRYFLAVSETLNFTKAAERCNVSQPALTKAIKKLEDEVGAELIRREGRNSHLTSVGKLLRHEFKKLQAGVNDTVQAVKRSLSLDATSLNVAVMCSIGPHMYADMFRKFKGIYPGIKLVLTDTSQDNLPASLLEGHVDCALYAGHGPLCHERLNADTLYSEDMVVAFQGGHPFEDMKAVPMKVAAAEPYIDRLHCEFRSKFLAFVEDNDIPLKTAYCSEREGWIQAMIASGNGVCVLPEYVLTRTDIHFRPVTDPALRRDVQLVHVNDRTQSAAQQAFQEFLLAEHAESGN